MSVLQGLCAAPSAFNKQLVAAWKGAPNDDQIYYSLFNGTTWSPAATIGGNTSTGPALAVFGSSVYAAWKGEWSDPRLFFAKFNGSTWDAQAQIPDVYSEFGPALGIAGTELVAAWKNAFNQSICYSVYNGQKWSAQATIPGVGSSVGPSLAAVGNTLYAAWKGAGSDQGIYYASYISGTWSIQAKIPNVATSVGPSLAAIGTKLYAVWKGENSDQGLYYASFDGVKWSAQAQIAGVGSSTGAALAGYNGKLYAMWKGESADTRLWNAYFDGTKWSAQVNNIPGNTGPDPLTLLPAPTSGNTNYLMADSKGAKMTGTSVTIIIAEDIVPDSTENYSFQINCNSPAQTSGAAPFVWQQFGFRIAANELFFWVNCYRRQDEPASPLINWDSRPPRMAANIGVVSLPNNRLPKGWQLTTNLVTDGSSRVTGFSFSIAQPNGTVLNSPEVTLLSLNSSVAADNLAPILNCQAILVGENGGNTTDFSAGQGVLLCYETDNLTASASQDESGEGSNVSYSLLPTSYPNGEFYQLFGIGLS